MGINHISFSATVKLFSIFSLPFVLSSTPLGFIVSVFVRLFLSSSCFSAMKMSFIMYLIANYNCVPIEFSSLLRNFVSFRFFFRRCLRCSPFFHYLFCVAVQHRIYMEISSSYNARQQRSKKKIIIKLFLFTKKFLFYLLSLFHLMIFSIPSQFLCSLALAVESNGMKKWIKTTSEN